MLRNLSVEASHRALEITGMTLQVSPGLDANSDSTKSIKRLASSKTSSSDT